MSIGKQEPMLSFKSEIDEIVRSVTQNSSILEL
jgi:hypothetical protein